MCDFLGVLGWLIVLGMVLVSAGYALGKDERRKNRRQRRQAQQGRYARTAAR